MTDKVTNGVNIAVDYCPIHKVYAISINDRNTGTGTRLTPSKCCGQWKVLMNRMLSPKELADMVETLERYEQ